jgi:5'-nucleotidase (lipoprotein e(P4) family)
MVRHSVVCLMLFVAAGCGARAPATIEPAASAGRAATTRETHEDLHAVLWMQTAAEYRALTTSAYARAAAVLEQALRDPSWTAAVEQTGAYQSLRPAVVLDLDETVFDNSAFQGQLVRDRRAYTEDAWRDWVRAREAAAIPGAQAFIHAAEARGVEVFYVSNRAAADEEATLLNLRALGIETNGDTLLSSGEQGWTSDKAARRASICRNHRVLMLVGDDLGDFLPVARLESAERAALVDQYAGWWLARWVLLPNPSYGSWVRALTPGLTSDRDVLATKMAMVKGYR